MKLTKSQLKRIIKEELKKNLKEIHGMPSGEEYSSAQGAMPPGAFGASKGMMSDLSKENYAAFLGMSVDELPAFLRDEEDLDALGAKIGDIDREAMDAIPYKLKYPRGERNLEQIEQAFIANIKGILASREG